MSSFLSLVFVLFTTLLLVEGYPECWYYSFKPRPSFCCDDTRTRQVINFGRGCQNPSAIPRISADKVAGPPRDLSVTFNRDASRPSVIIVMISFKPPNDASISNFRYAMVKIMPTEGSRDVASCLIFNFTRIDWNRIGQETVIEFEFTPQTDRRRECFNDGFTSFSLEPEKNGGRGKTFYIEVTSLPIPDVPSAPVSVGMFFRVPGSN